MNRIQVILQPAFVLHTRQYRDTSYLVELFTKDYGRLTVVARGARSMKSKLHGTLVPFLPLLVSFSGKGELRTLHQAEADGVHYDLRDNMFLSGFYLNELLVRLLPRHEAYPHIYQAYQHTLNAMVVSKQLEPELRLFEKTLLANLGYGLQLNRTLDNELVVEEEQYVFVYGSGLSKAKTEHPNNFSGKHLLALHTEKFTTIDELRDAKRLLRSVLAVLLGNKPLKSRELFYAPVQK